MSTLLPEAPSPSARDSIGARIAAALSERRMTQVELARQLVGPDEPDSRVESMRRLLNKWIRDLHVPGPVHAQRLAAILEKPTNHFTKVGLTSSAGASRERAPEDDSYALEFVFDFALAQPKQKTKLPKPFGKDTIAKLAPFFGEEHILLNEVEDYGEDGKSAVAVARLSHDVWALGQWYNDAPGGLSGTKLIVPGILILEALAQTSCVALLTDEKYQGRTVLCAGYDNVRLRKTVQSGDWLRIEAEQKGTPHSQVFHYFAEARKLDPTGTDASSEVVARGMLTLAVH